jgi:putative Mg2+ transporter-C (MgtC) family protein
MSPWQTDVLRILLAAFLGGVIGVERQIHGKVAGVRTNTLICLGSAALMIISERMGVKYHDSVGRIAAQIISGIGFVGAGAIIRDRGGIHGLTTAATIWLVAAVGMAAGAGFYFLAIATTVLGVAILIGLRNWPSHPGDAKSSHDTPG